VFGEKNTNQNPKNNNYKAKRPLKRRRHIDISTKGEKGCRKKVTSNMKKRMERIISIRTNQ